MMFYYLIRLLTSIFELNYQNQAPEAPFHPIESYFNLQEEYSQGIIQLIDPNLEILPNQQHEFLNFPILSVNYPQEKTALG